MSRIDRRLFMQVSGGVLGASAMHSPEVSPAATASERLPAKIYTLFFDIAPARDDIESIEPMTNAEIVARLERECGGVEFVVRDLTQTGADRPTLAAVLNEMKGLRREGYDGVLICGWPRDYDVLRTGLPTINVAVVNDFMNVPYPLFKKNRVIGGLIDPWRFSSDPEVIDRMFRDLADQLKLIRALKRMRSEHILTAKGHGTRGVTSAGSLTFSPIIGSAGSGDAGQPVEVRRPGFCIPQTSRSPCGKSTF
jgi:hypothetical protein